jgi:magnesium-transporting ATPase (P-type)
MPQLPHRNSNATVGDRECMAFSGTMVVSGRATGVVVATGSETELGRINQLLASVSALETPLLRQIKQFGYAITAVIGVVGVLVHPTIGQQCPLLGLKRTSMDANLECALAGGQFQAAVLTGCWACRSSYCTGLK